VGTADVAQDSRFEMRHNVVLNQVKRGDDTLAIQFTRWDDLTEDQKVHIAELGKRGQTIIREQKRSVVGLGLLKLRIPRVFVHPFRLNPPCIARLFVRARSLGTAAVQNIC